MPRYKAIEFGLRNEELPIEGAKKTNFMEIERFQFKVKIVGPVNVEESFFGVIVMKEF